MVVGLKPRESRTSLSLAKRQFIVYNEYIHIVAGWSSLVARRAHNPKVIGSNPIPATKYGPVVQLVRMPACHAGGRGFESRPDRHFFKR